MITINDAKNLNRGTIVYVIGLFNADGSAMRCRINGQIKLWKTRPTEFQLPIKRGLKEYTYITDDNNHFFTLTAPESINKKNVYEANKMFSWYAKPTIQ